IGTNGSVAIGGTGTDATLHIQSAVGGYDRLTQISPNTANKNAFNIMAAKNSGGTDLWWSWGVRNDNVFAIEQGVNYSLNSSSGFFFDSGGQAYKSGGGSWAAISDARVKTNIEPISDAASRIMALKPSSFDYRAPEAHAGRVSDRGFIAQEFEEVYPHSVSESATVNDAEQALVGEDGKIKAVSLNNDFFADLVALVQEQQATINDLRARMAQLEGK
ncbi:MAG: tail fiber domain-containing protein, partial [Sphingomonadaceae bacterium]|nr:tail fiber domain-containing protein [Sphingomonadaceae bacterium]